jgi:hypothetical protein
VKCHMHVFMCMDICRRVAQVWFVWCSVHVCVYMAAGCPAIGARLGKVWWMVCRSVWRCVSCCLNSDMHRGAEFAAATGCCQLGGHADALLSPTALWHMGGAHVKLGS